MDDDDIMFMILIFMIANVVMICGDNFLDILELAQTRLPVIKVQQFYELTVPGMLDMQFRRYFRMNYATFNSLVQYMGALGNYFDERHTRIPVNKKIAMTLAYLGSKSTTQQLAHLFGVAEESFIRNTELIMECMLEKLDQIIAWPSKRDLPRIARRFDEIGRFLPRVVGCIDCAHIEILLTEEKPYADAYRNYKTWYSIHLQGTCTYDLRWIHVDVGFPGRSHDGLVFQESSLQQFLEESLDTPGLPLRETYHILGDKAYPCLKQLLTPYKERLARPCTHSERIFNQHLASKRQNVERAFSLLFRRFPRLHLLNMKSEQKKIKVVMAACMLHNICIMENDNVDYYLQKAKEKQFVGRFTLNGPCSTEANSNLGKLKRDILLPDVVQHHF